jgi:uncharacterized protein (TIGR02145 family)
MKIFPFFFVLTICSYFLMNSWSCVKSGNNYQIALDSLNNALLYSTDAYATIKSGELSDIDEVGFCWNETGKPTIDDKVQSGGTPAIFKIFHTVVGLSSDKTYYVRAFMKGEDFLVYSDEMAIKTWDGKAADVEGNIYQGTQVGNQGWLTENLRSTKYADGTSISTGNGSNRSYWYGSGHSFVPNFDTDINNDGLLDEQDSLLYVQEYGLLYSWYAANNFYDPVDNASLAGMRVVEDVRDICPAGFHIPTNMDWQDLRNYLSLTHGPAGNAVYLTSQTGWLDGLNGNDTYGFNLKPNAYWHEPNASHSNILGRSAFMWLSTEANSDNAEYLQADNLDKQFISGVIGKGIHGLCVRCIKDK